MPNNTNFWTQTTAPRDPKRSFRFKVTLFGEIVWWAKSFTQPNVTVDVAEHDFMMHKFYFPGKVSWDTVSTTLVDPVIPATLDGLLGALQDSGYYIPANPNDAGAFTSIRKAAATNQLGSASNVLCEVVDAQGVTVHKWTLNNAFIIGITPSDLSYDSDELMTVDLEIRYDWATYEGVGADGGRGVLFDQRNAAAQAGLTGLNQSVAAGTFSPEADDELVDAIFAEGEAAGFFDT